MSARSPARPHLARIVHMRDTLKMRWSDIGAALDVRWTLALAVYHNRRRAKSGMDQAAEIAMRRREVERRHKAGEPVKAIVAALAVSRCTIEGDIRALIGEGRLVARVPMHMVRPYEKSAQAGARRSTAVEEERFAAAMGGRVYDMGPFVERPFARVDRPAAYVARGSTASSCAEEGASGGWAWRASAQTYGKAGAA